MSMIVDLYDGEKSLHAFDILLKDETLFRENSCGQTMRLPFFDGQGF